MVAEWTGEKKKVYNALFFYSFLTRSFVESISKYLLSYLVYKSKVKN